MMKKSSTQGFTLVELLVSIAIFSSMTVVAYAGIAAIMNNDKTSLEHETALKRLQRTMVFIEKDIRQLSLRTRNNGYSALLPPLQADAGSDSELMEFTRAGHSNPTDLTRSSLRRIRYVVEEEKLQRWSWSLVDHSDIEASKVTLLEGVTEASVAFLPVTGAKVSSWSALDKLPIAVEVKLTTERWGQIRRVLPTYY